jgi:hypothetical protein
MSGNSRGRGSVLVLRQAEGLMVTGPGPLGRPLVVWGIGRILQWCSGNGGVTRPRAGHYTRVIPQVLSGTSQAGRQDYPDTSSRRHHPLYTVQA